MNSNIYRVEGVSIYNLKAKRYIFIKKKRTYNFTKTFLSQIFAITVDLHSR